LEPAFVVDVFGEVDEQIRSDRLRTFLQRAWPVFIGALVAALAVVIGVWGYGQYQTSQSAKASQAYSDALDTETKGDDAKAFDQFAAIAKGNNAYAALALMQQAGIRMDQNKPAEAVPLFDKAAAATKSAMIVDAAGLKAAYALMDTAPLSQMVDRLTPLAKPDRPYHGQAREALAMAKVGAGQLKDAKADLVALSLLSDTPDSLRQRAQAVIALIDTGTAGSLKLLAQQALTATPIQLAPPPQPEQPQSPDAAQSPDQAQGQPQGQPEAPQ
jgi:hypothetical protein